MAIHAKEEMRLSIEGDFIAFIEAITVVTFYIERKVII